MNRTMRETIAIVSAMGLILLCGCQTGTPKEALTLSPGSLEDRQLQTRTFATGDEGEVLSAVASALQDLGFNLDESEVGLGLLVASQTRDATDGGQIAAAIIVLAFSGLWMPTDHHQLMRACVITDPGASGTDRIAVRVTFQRIVWDSRGKVTKREAINDPEVYQEFFARLSKALFLEANRI